MSALNHFTYALIRALISPLGQLPPKALHTLGRVLGRLLYYFLPKFRKRALSNLALASKLELTNAQIVEYAKLSFENLAITMLEYGKLKSSNNLDYIRCENPQEAEKIIQSGKGVIFFCAHQANWEVLFIEGTRRMPGVAIGRPIKNRPLYDWITSIRERFGGEMIAPRDAIAGGLRALKSGKFLGIVGDQGMPESHFSSSFLGRRAYTSPVPALLSYKTGAPMIFAETIRERDGSYKIHYSPAIYPDKAKPKDSEVRRMMESMLSSLEESISKRPGQWMWQHNRWKQETPADVFYAFRYDSILIVLPEDFDPQIPRLFKKIYPRAFLTALTQRPIEGFESILYTNSDQLLLKDYRFKCVFNFTTHDLKRHFLRQSVDKYLSVNDLRKYATRRECQPISLIDTIKWAICRDPNSPNLV